MHLFRESCSWAVQYYEAFEGTMPGSPRDRCARLTQPTPSSARVDYLHLYMVAGSCTARNGVFSQLLRLRSRSSANYVQPETYNAGKQQYVLVSLLVYSHAVCRNERLIRFAEVACIAIANASTVPKSSSRHPVGCCSLLHSVRFN